MKLTIIGHMCIDVNHYADGKEVESLGGIYFAVAAMANIAEKNDTIYPVFGIGKDAFEPVKEKLSHYPNVNTTGLFSFEGETNHVHVFHKEGKSVIECSESISAPIPFSRIEPFLSVNGILVNMISGSDITLETLDEIRLAARSKNIPIHLDLHCLTTATDNDHVRIRRPLSDWRRWCFMVNSVQMNEEEAAGLTRENYDELTLAKQMLPLMVNAMCITRGGEGVTMFRQEHKKVFRNDEPGIARETTGRSVGCGDVFGASFLYRYCKSKKPEEALEFANRVAAGNARLSGSERIDELQEFRAVNGNSQ
jgi:sugar/nucleoside kinase (ribokinase family)